MKRLRIFAVLLTLIATLLVLPMHAFADFGDFGGDSDYGDSDFDYDSDYDYDGDGTYTSGDASDLIPIAVFVIVVIIIAIGKNDSGSSGGGSETSDKDLQSMDKYQELDPNFDIGELQQRLSNWYVRLQDTWCEGDITPVRPYLSDAYWQQMNIQLQKKKEQGHTPHTERIAVLGVKIRGFYQSGGEDHLIAQLKTRIVDYTTDKSGEVVSGSRTKEKFMTYEWDLTRPTGKITEKDKSIATVNCPNCGANLNINETTKCPFCDSIVTVHDHDWVINSIRGISQRTN